MSAPGNGPLNFDGLPVDVGALCRVAQGILIHSDWLSAYGVSEAQFRTVSRETLPLAGRLQQIADLDGSTLTVERALDRRAVGTCRDYALMLCGMLREQGVPARVRCGFAAYFRRVWEDHWICEYWREGRWRRAPMPSSMASSRQVSASASISRTCPLTCSSPPVKRGGAAAQAKPTR